MYRSLSDISLLLIYYKYYTMETIKQLITDGKTDEAIRLLDEYIEKTLHRMRLTTCEAMPTAKKATSARPSATISPPST